MKNITKKQCKKDKRVKIDKFDLFVIIMMAFTVGMLVEKIAIKWNILDEYNRILRVNQKY